MRKLRKSIADVVRQAEKSIFQTFQRFFGGIEESFHHLAMNYGNAELLLYMAQYHGHIAEAHHPLRIFTEGGEVYAIDDTYTSIATTPCNDGLNFGIVESFLQVFGTKFIFPGNLVMLCQYRIINTRL